MMMRYATRQLTFMSIVPHVEFFRGVFCVCFPIFSQPELEEAPSSAGGPAKRKKKARAKKTVASTAAPAVTVVSAASTANTAPARTPQEEQLRMSSLKSIVSESLAELSLSQGAKATFTPFTEEHLVAIQKKIEKDAAASEKALQTLVSSGSSSALDQVVAAFQAQVIKTKAAELDAAKWRHRNTLTHQDKDAIIDQLQKSKRKGEQLENLCRELERKYQATLAEHRQQQVSFQDNIKSISDKIDSHSASVSAREEENAMLRDKVQQLLKLDQIRSEQVTHETKRAELERLIFEEKLKHAASVINVEQQKALEATRHAEEALTTNIALTKQLSEWQQRFAGLNDSLSAYTGLAAQVRPSSRVYRWIGIPCPTVSFSFFYEARNL
jgi:hypothetical protein